MAYRFRKHETVSEGCRRILLEQAASIISALSDRGGNLDDRIHDVRKRIKRLRALMHLLPLKLEAEMLAIHQDTLNSTARKLAPARDATAVLAAFAEMALEFTGGAIERIRELLEESVRHAKRRALGPEKLVALAGAVRVSCEALARAGTAEDGWMAVAPGLHEGYASARKRTQEALAEPKVENLHESRRHAKRLWEQLRLLRRALPKAIARQLPRLEKLTDLLGRHHDFHLLLGTLQEAAAHGLEVATFPPLLKRIHREMGKCLKRTRKLGKAIFTLRPKAFSSHLHAGWKDWHKK